MLIVVFLVVSLWSKWLMVTDWLGFAASMIWRKCFRWIKYWINYLGICVFVNDITYLGMYLGIIFWGILFWQLIWYTLWVYCVYFWTLWGFHGHIGLSWLSSLSWTLERGLNYLVGIWWGHNSWSLSLWTQPCLRTSYHSCRQTHAG